jgi:hypothetical protein
LLRFLVELEFEYGLFLASRQFWRCAAFCGLLCRLWVCVPLGRCLPFSGHRGRSIFTAGRRFAALIALRAAVCPFVPIGNNWPPLLLR